MTTRIVQVIYSDEATIGKGTKDDLVRRTPSLRTLDGEVICSFDCGPTAQAGVNEQFVSEYALRKLERQS